MINEERIINKFIEMVKIYSPSLEEREMANYLIGELKKLGLEVYEDNAGEINKGNAGNIIGILKGDGPEVMFSSHMDTVTPCKNIIPIIKDGKIMSKGDTILGGDDKAGIAAILEMLYIIKENNLKHPTLVIVFSIAEEIRLLGATSFDESKFNLKYGFILDSSGKPGSVVKQAPYHEQIKLKFIGKAAHAGIEPEKGISALYVAAKAISKLNIGRIDEETTLNLGIINGGHATNIVMEELNIVGESRSFDEKKLGETIETVIEICQNTAEEYGAKLDYELTREYDGFNFSEDYELIKLVKQAADNLKFPFKAESLGGGSDTNVYNKKGIDTVNLGIGMSKVHSTSEYIEKEDLINSAELILELVKVISNDVTK
ncbi:M20/M25/M40 family metallo-hydrolase [Haliovirga abyssi]|uniref:Peptidase M20 dimerisation domain-containing protein n=1 Tax=Haliovirga abyssi TaxID=2996794 RepID=A0AAU9DE76_9FUSO|nr:M20/M25/M40 family metallo-hydrolase [Haliovirga abyssi]BDU50498.1 hypothetical protein HLVA_10670 [Haliovirga abyssi]